jgi:hypothetical protein
MPAVKRLSDSPGERYDSVSESVCSFSREDRFMASLESSGTTAIGETAGVVWKTLAVQGPTSLTKLIKETGAPRDAVLQALGWLAREDKIEVEDGRTKKFSLK